MALLFWGVGGELPHNDVMLIPSTTYGASGDSCLSWSKGKITLCSILNGRCGVWKFYWQPLYLQNGRTHLCASASPSSLYKGLSLLFTAEAQCSFNSSSAVKKALIADIIEPTWRGFRDRDSSEQCSAWGWGHILPVCCCAYGRGAIYTPLWKQLPGFFVFLKPEKPSGDKEWNGSYKAVG